MSFFSNPLAEEEEVVPPDYPLEQYDERKREDDFNELLVRSTKLESQQSANAGTGAGGDAEATAVRPDLVECLKENQQIRSSLEELWGRVSVVEENNKSVEASPTAVVAGSTCYSSSPCAFSPDLESALNAASTHMQAEAAEQATRTQQLRRAIAEASVSFAALTTAHSNVTPHRMTSHNPPPVSSPHSLQQTAEFEEAVRGLERQLPSMSAEEVALASASVQQLFYGLRSWTALTERHAKLKRAVQAKTEEWREAYRAAETVAAWVAAKRLESDGRRLEESDRELSASPAAPLSFDLALAEALNKSLSEGNAQLESALSGLLAASHADVQLSEKVAPLAGSALVQYVALRDYAEELECEVERLGRAVLYLRAVLSTASDESAKALGELVSQGSNSATFPTGLSTLADTREALWAARLSRIRAVAASLAMREAASTSSLASSSALAMTPQDAVDAILSYGLTKLLEVHDACLNAVALLSTYYEKQSTSAAFLRHALREGGTVEDGVMERLLDVPLPDLDEVCRSLTEVEVTCAAVPAAMERFVAAAATASAAVLVRWETVRQLLVQLVQDALERVHPEGNGADLTALWAACAQRANSPRTAASTNPTGTDYVRTQPDWADALEEEARAFREEKAGEQRQLQSYWATQQAETNKKLTWLMKQPNAPLLVQLCNAEKEAEELRQQVETLSAAHASTSSLQDTLMELESQVAREARHNAQLQEEVQQLQARQQDLANELAGLTTSSA